MAKRRYRLTFPSDGATAFITTSLKHKRAWAKYYGKRCVAYIKRKCK